MSLDVGSDMTLADLKAVIQSEIQIPPTAQNLMHNNQALNDDSRTLSQIGISEADILTMNVRAQQQPGRAAGIGRQAGSAQDAALTQRQQMLPDPETIRLHVLGDPQVLEGVRRRNPELADAASDPARWRELLAQQQRAELEEEARKERRMAELNANPFDVDAQREIEEIIRQNMVTENLQTAMEHTPEGKFGSYLGLSNYLDLT